MEFTDSVHSILDHKGRYVHCIRPDDTVYYALEQMAELGIGALVVLENDQLIGIISERDYARKIILQGRTSRDARIREIMITNVVTASPTNTVDDCMKLMTDHHMRHLPIIEEGKVVGMLTMGDLVKWIIDRQRETIEQLEHYISSGYMR
jgi:CBS domain-containing protein